MLGRCFSILCNYVFKDILVLFLLFFLGNFFSGVFFQNIFFVILFWHLPEMSGFGQRLETQYRHEKYFTVLHAGCLHEQGG